MCLCPSTQIISSVSSEEIRLKIVYTYTDRQSAGLCEHLLDKWTRWPTKSQVSLAHSMAQALQCTMPQVESWFSNQEQAFHRSPYYQSPKSKRAMIPSFQLTGSTAYSWSSHQFSSVQLSSIQSLSHVQLFATPWTTACQASLSITNSWSLLKPTSGPHIREFSKPEHWLSPCDVCRDTSNKTWVLPSILLASPSEEEFGCGSTEVSSRSMEWSRNEETNLKNEIDSPKRATGGTWGRRLKSEEMKR